MLEGLWVIDQSTMAGFDLIIAILLSQPVTMYFAFYFRAKEGSEGKLHLHNLERVKTKMINT